MAFRIIGGNGKSYEACVTKEGSLCTFSITESDFNHHSEDGQAFLLSSTEITLTDSTESGVLYLKNNSNFDLHFVWLQMGWQQSTDGTDGFQLKSYLNPSTGTVISDAIAGASLPLNHSSANEFTGLVYKGDQGKTFTDGIFFGSIYGDATKADYREYDIEGNILSKGQGFGFTITPPAGNSNFLITVSFRCFFKSRNTGTT
jgi:hypothetical protein